MKNVKTLPGVLLLSLLAVLPFWQSVTADETSSQEVMQQTAMVNINTATADELASLLKGIGEKRAVAIVAYREENGPFTTVEQLQSVKGVGEKVLEQNRANLSVK
ncbi:MAG: hypothetical protein COB19_01765 [Porticoccus sp.]|nr:MAG: hypothetical protein COB19_01765 [Porticoccus sp.]